uniref:Reverse transcriptase domain-containing protein n=1 Tax=Graphocephala atropunctata TaxID=36148 RepID=A0A1B6MBU4_9HEMI
MHSKYNYTVLCIAEHWLKSEEVGLCIPENLTLANSFCRSQHVHGGVSVFVAKHIAFKRIDLSNYCQELHFEVTGIELVEKNLIVISLYRSPKGKTDIFLQSLEKLLNYLVGLKRKIVISGDLNAEFDISTTKNTVTRFLNTLRQYNMYCTNDKPTRGESCLDNIVTNINTQNFKCEVLKLELSDHDALYFEMFLISSSMLPYSSINKPTQITSRPITQGKINKFRKGLAEEDFEKILGQNEPASIVFEKFFNTFLVMFEKCFPKTVRRIELKPKNKAKSTLNWYTPQLAHMKSNILLCRDLYRKHRSVQLLTLLRSLRSHYRSALREAKRLKNEEIIENSSNKCRAAWTIINNAAGKVSYSTRRPNIQPDDFNSFFKLSVEEISSKVNASIGVAVSYLEKVKSVQPNINCVFSTVTLSDVYGIIMSLKSSASKDVYGMSSDLLKSIASEILEPLTYCINLCIVEGVFPTSLKLSRVVPIFKKGDHDNPSSYRPISCIPVLAKIYEKVLKIQICHYFESLNLFSNSQFGYRSGKSTVQAIDTLVEQLLLALENCSSAQVTLCDLSKAFDTVQHDILLAKLQFYGFQGTNLTVFESYLKDRKQLVQIGGNDSKIVEINVGVPQGSILGPILFLILINDVSFNLSSFTTIYADDTSLLNVHNNIEQLEILSESTLLNASSWFETNGLFLNNDKTQKLLVSLRHVNRLVSNNAITLLGINIDPNLSWKIHIESVCKKLSRVIFLLVNLKSQVSNKYLLMAYYSFFESVVRYGLIVWGNGVGIENILILQKKAVRILTGSKPLDHCRPLFIQIKVLTIVNLYIFDVLVLVKKNLSMYFLRNMIHSHDTRFNDKLALPRCRLSKTKNYHKYLGLSLFNKLPDSWKHFTDEKFTKVVHGWLSRNPFYKIEEYYKCEIK